MAARTRKPQKELGVSTEPTTPKPKPETNVTVLIILEMVLDATLVYIRSIPSLLMALFYLVYPRPCKDVRGEIVLVTGSGQGLGRELALLFAAQGSDLVCVDIQADKNEETARLARALGVRARTYVCDVADRAAVFELAKEVGRVDILVNNAGIVVFGSFWKCSEEETRRVTDINFLSHFWTLQAFVPAMEERNHGHVVCISSMGGIMGWPGGVLYASTKFAITGLMMSLSHEMRNLKKNVKMTTVYPYFIQTRPEISELIDSRVPMLTVKEAAEAIFLGIRQNLITFSVPRHLLPFSNVLKMLPESVVDKWHKTFYVKTTDPSDKQETLS